MSLSKTRSVTCKVGVYAQVFFLSREQKVVLTPCNAKTVFLHLGYPVGIVVCCTVLALITHEYAQNEAGLILIKPYLILVLGYYRLKNMHMIYQNNIVTLMAWRPISITDTLTRAHRTTNFLSFFHFARKYELIYVARNMIYDQSVSITAFIYGYRLSPSNKTVRISHNLRFFAS